MHNVTMIKLFLFSLLVVFCSAAEKIPDFIKVCRRNEPNMLQCFQEAVEKLKPQFIEGNLEYDIPSVEPLIIEDTLNQSTTGLLVLTTDIKTYGCSSYIPKRVDINFEKQIYEIDALLPMLRIEANYTIAGKLLLLTIHGDGPISINITNCVTKNTLQGEIYQGDDGEPHLKFTSLSIEMNVEDGQIKIENLFNGDKILNAIINDTVNKNFVLFLNELKPLIVKALAPTFINIANKIVGRFSYNDLFPQ